MNKKIIISLSVIGAIAAIAIGGTMAYFSDTENSNGNTFTAGTLNLTVDDQNNPLPVKFALSNLKPTDSGNISYNIDNVGSIDGYLNLQNITVANTEGTDPESETNTAEPGELGSHINVSVKIGATEIYNGSLDGFASFVTKNNITLADGASTTVTIDWVWNLLSASDNDAQGDVATVGIEFSLSQNSL